MDLFDALFVSLGMPRADFRQRRSLARNAGFELAQFGRSIRLDHGKGRFRQARMIDQRNFQRLGGVTHQRRPIRVRPALEVAAALEKPV